MRTRFTISLIAFLALSWAGGYASARAAIQGSWIWCPYSGGTRNMRAYFRKSFDLATVPISAQVKVAADSRYLLYVNGHRVGRGSPRALARDLNYETWDVTPFLVAGRNAIAALVLHYGDNTGQYQVGRPGFLCEARIVSDGQERLICSDATWKCRLDNAWARDQDRMGSALGYPEVLDARLLPAGWQEAAFDDSGWPSPSVLGSAGMAPWTNLMPTDIPPQRETVVYPTAVLDVRNVEPSVDASRIDFGGRYVDGRLPAVGYAETWLYTPVATDVTFQIGRSEPCKVWLNGASILERPSGRVCETGRDEIPGHLAQGWNRFLLKSVKVSQHWYAYIGIVQTNGPAVVASSDRSLSSSDTWLISPQYTVTGDAAAGYATVYAPETDPDTVAWGTLVAPARPIPVVATVFRSEARRAAPAPPVPGASSLTGPAASAVFPVSNTLNGSVLLDMGREVAGYPRIVVSGAQGGEIVDLAYAEAMEDEAGTRLSPALGVIGLINPERDDIRYADRLICRAGDNVFEVFERHAFRYIQVDVRNNAQPLTVTSLSVIESTYPVTEAGAFECSDPVLNRIWAMGRRTVLLNMEDAYTDCPWRERMQWWGDAAVETLAGFYAFGDGQLMRRGLLQAARSQTSEGTIQGAFPTGWTNETTLLATFGLMWVNSIWEYYMFTGDASVLPALQPSIDRFLAYLRPHLDAGLGLLTDVPHWVFIDWAEGMAQQNTGVSAAFNMTYYRALTSASRIAEVEGNGLLAEQYAGDASAVLAAINDHLWSPELGLYADRILGGTRSGTASQQANALAILYGVASPDRFPEMAARMTGDASVTKAGTPFFGGFVVEALHAAGLHDAALAYIRENWGPMDAWGSTTVWEYWNNLYSLCHGWGAAPTYSLPSRILGIGPLSPGWADWEMSPNWGGLAYARGTVPTPRGVISARWERQPDGLHVNVTVPSGTVAHIRLPEAGLETALWTVNGSPTLPAGVSREIADGRWAVLVSAAGEYSIDALYTQKLGFNSDIRASRAGMPLRDAPAVRALDSKGQPLTSFAGAVSLAIKPGTGAAGAILSGGLTESATAGIATFDDVYIDRPGSGYVLVASAEGFASAESKPFDVVPFTFTALDALEGLRWASGLSVIQGPVRTRFDVDGDGRVDLGDVILIYRKAAGLDANP